MRPPAALAGLLPFDLPMRKRLGNFLLLCGLICLVIFFTSNAIFLDDAVFFFGGVSLISLGLLLKRRARRKEQEKKTRRSRRDKSDLDDAYD